MNVSEIGRVYTGYVNQTNSVSKSENKNEDFSTLLNSVSNKEEITQKKDLLDIQAYNIMSESQKAEHRKKIGEEYGLAKALAFGIATSFSEVNMQKAVFDNLSNISNSEILDLTSDIQLSTNSYLSGNELKASYSINLDKNGQVDYGSADSKDVENYFNNISLEEFKYLFSTLKNSHESLAKTVGIEQASKYSKVYDGILSSYNSYVNSSKSEVFYG